MNDFKPYKCSFVCDEFDDLDKFINYKDLYLTLYALNFVQSVQFVISYSDKEGYLNYLNKNKVEGESFNLKYFLQGTYNKFDHNLKYILVKKFPIHFLLHPIFIENYVDKGCINITSINDDLNTEDICIALSKKKILFLYVNYNIYKSLGIPGQLAYGFKKKDLLRKYIIKINLKDKKFNNYNSRYYKRIYGLLKKGNFELELLIKWENDLTKCSNLSPLRFLDMLKYCHLKNDEFFDERSAKNIEIHQCAPSVRKFDLTNFHIPQESDEFKNIDLNNEVKLNLNEDNFCQLLIEYLGLALCGINEKENDFEVNSMRLDNFESSNLKCIEVNGFFNSLNIKRFFIEAYHLLKNNDDLDFIAIIVNGFENTILSWDIVNQYHSKDLSGENLYGCFMSKKRKNFLWRIGDKTNFGIDTL